MSDKLKESTLFRRREGSEVHILRTDMRYRGLNISVILYIGSIRSVEGKRVYPLCTKEWVGEISLSHIRGIWNPYYGYNGL